MFTGIVQAVGAVRSAVRADGGATLAIACPFERIALGESIAVDGVCLTVTAVRDGAFTADASAETLARTTLGDRRPGSRVNLERALAAGDRLGGHIVSGHVDATGTLRRREASGTSEKLVFHAPDEVARFVAEKGSITVDGVSLTVNGVHGNEFDVMVVPFTQSATTLGERGPGDRVNLEADVIARYVLRALTWRGGEADTAAAGDDRWRGMLERLFG